MSINFKKSRRRIKNYIASGLMFKIATDTKLQGEMRGMKHHFETSDSWPLSYEHYRVSSGLTDMEFNILLELLQYKIQYRSESASIVFGPQKLPKRETK